MLFRKLALLSAVSLAIFCTAGVQAQIGVFGTVTGERLSGITCQAPDAICGTSSGTVNPFGGEFGAFYDFRHLGPVRFGPEVRGNVLTANRSASLFQGGAGVVRQYGALGGVHASVGTPIPFLRPYGSVDVGYAKTNADTGNPETYQNYFQAKGVLGVDIPLLPFLDFRLIELTAGGLFGNGNTHSTQSIGAGVVFHSLR